MIALKVELDTNISPMRLDGESVDEQQLGDLFVGLIFGDQLKNSEFGGGQSVKPRGGRLGLTLLAEEIFCQRWTDVVLSVEDSRMAVTISSDALSFKIYPLAPRRIASSKNSSSL